MKKLIAYFALGVILTSCNKKQDDPTPEDISKKEEVKYDDLSGVWVQSENHFFSDTLKIGKVYYSDSLKTYCFDAYGKFSALEGYRTYVLKTKDRYFGLLDYNSETGIIEDVQSHIPSRPLVNFGVVFNRLSDYTVNNTKGIPVTIKRMSALYGWDGYNLFNPSRTIQYQKVE